MLLEPQQVVIRLSLLLIAGIDHRWAAIILRSYALATAVITRLRPQAMHGRLRVLVTAGAVA